MYFLGGIKLQLIPKLPEFRYKDIGRFILCKDTNSAYIGGLDDWISLSPEKYSINSNHINYGFGESEVNASSIPAVIKDGKSISIQQLLLDFENDIINLRSGKGIEEKSLGNFHIDGKTYQGFTADDMFIRNVFNGFDGAKAYTISVEEAIGKLDQKRSSKIFHPKNNLLGRFALLRTDDVYSTLLNIDDYLYNLHANQISIDSSSLQISEGNCNCKNLQEILNLFGEYINDLKIKISQLENRF